MSPKHSQQRSLVKLLIVVIALCVTAILAVKTVYEYQFYQRLVEDRVKSEALVSLRKLSQAITPYIQSFSINEYEQLIRTELDASSYLAIVASNQQFAELIGADEYQSGSIRSIDGQLDAFSLENEDHTKWLETAYDAFSIGLYNHDSETIGSLTIYLTNDEIQKWLSPILYNSVVTSALMLLIIVGFVAFIVTQVLRSLGNLSQGLANHDKDGMPLNPLPEYHYRELSPLSETINNMLIIVRQSRSELQFERDRLERVLEGTQAGSWEWNVQTGEIIINERWAEIIGYCLNDLKPISIDTWIKYAHPVDLEHSEKELQRHFLGETPHYDIEIRMRHKEGHWVWVSDRGRVQSWTEDGKPLWMSGTHQEITERKQNEAALAKSEARYRQLSELSPSALWQADSKGILTYASGQWMEITGAGEESQTGKSWLNSVHPYDYDRIEKLWHAHASTSTFEVEYRVQQSDGALAWVLCIANASTDEESAEACWIGTITDITKLKQTEEKLNDASIKAESANIAKSRFLATMSHEIRTPMNGIMGLAQLLESDEVDEKTRRSYAKTILKSGKSLLSLLNDILDISKVEAGKLTLEERPLDPSEIITDISRLFADTARKKSIDIVNNTIVDVDAHYIGDPLRVSQMLANLVNNAIKFSRPRGEVTITVEEKENYGSHALLEFSVADKGVGIAASKINSLFEPFSQSDNSTTRKYGGSGLGLSIVRGLSRLMEGDVGVESKENEGSRFWFQIRVRNNDWTKGHTSDFCSIESKPAKPETKTLSGKVLVVEDDKTNQLVAKAMLKKLGIQVEVANNGREAVHMITDLQEVYDAILMDINMPVMDGHSATMIIRNWENIEQKTPVPIIALTADAFPEDRDKCIEVGMNEFLTKPIIAEKLAAVLRHFL